MIGDFTPGKTVRGSFNTHTLVGVPITLAGSPTIHVYKDNGTTESNAGVTLTVDFDSKTGLHTYIIDTSADGTFYSAASDFKIILTAGTVDGQSVANTELDRFSINNRSAIRPTSADRTLDVTATGEAGIDWANIGGLTTTNNFTNTTVGVVTSLSGYAAGQSPISFKKNTDFGQWPFRMLLDDGSPAIGIAGDIVCERLIDGGTFAAMANTPTEKAEGFYSVNVVAVDVNANASVILKFTAPGCKMSWFFVPIQGK